MSDKRPIIKIPLSNLEKVLILISTVIIVTNWGLFIGMYSSLPEQIPSHFNFSGVPDKWSGRGSLVLPIIISTIIYISLTLLSRIPQYFNYTVKITEENAEKQYRNARLMILIMNLEILVYMLYTDIGSIFVALGKSSTLSLVSLPIFLVVLFGSMIYFIRRMHKLK